MNKKYIVRLSEEERQTCKDVIKKLKGTSEKIRRAQILLKADADGPAWIDEKIADAFNCRVQTIENIRKRLVTEGFERAFERKKCSWCQKDGARHSTLSVTGRQNDFTAVEIRVANDSNFLGSATCLVQELQVNLEGIVRCHGADDLLVFGFCDGVFTTEGFEVLKG